MPQSERMVGASGFVDDGDPISHVDPYPLGFPIAEKVNIKSIDKQLATRIYEQHHSYMADNRPVAVANHGIYLAGELVGAITYSPLLSSTPIRGHDIPRTRDVARVCVVNDTPNLASCALAKSQRQFLAGIPKVSLLVTFIRDDYRGSMFAALSGLGWERDGQVNSNVPGNVDYKEIYEQDKTRWVCEVREPDSPRYENQSSLLEYGGSQADDSGASSDSGSQ